MKILLYGTTLRAEHKTQLTIQEYYKGSSQEDLVTIVVPLEKGT